jgi:hypothetical protein
MASNFLDYFKTYVSNLPTTGIAKVYFEMNDVKNDASVKTWPFVYWDMSTASFVENDRTGKRKLKITCYAVDQWIAEEETTNTKIKAWDTLHFAFKAYLAKLETLETTYNCQVQGKNELNCQLYDRGGFSVEEDIAIEYKDIVIEIMC